METKNNNSYIGISTTLGAAGGALYGFKHPNEKSCLKMSKLTPTVVDTMREYKDSFNLSAAKKSVAEGALNLQEYGKVENIVKNLTDVMEKEQTVKDILNTPFEQRTVSFKDAVKEANMARPKLYKSLLQLNKNFQDKLAESKIFDKEKFEAATKAAKKKTIAMYKELSRGTAKGLAVGAAAGAAVGYFLNSISKNK